MFNYIFLQYIEVANRIKLQPLRLEFAMREFYFFLLSQHMGVSRF